MVSDRASLLTADLEQANLDNGSMDLAGLLPWAEAPSLQSRRAEMGRQGRQPGAAAQEEEAQQTGEGYRPRAKAKTEAADQ